MRDDYTKLKTEAANPRTAGIDKMSTLDMVRVMNEENRRVPEAVEAELPRALAEAIDRIAAAMQAGGHMIYVGAGTSGRLGVVDASEWSAHLWRGLRPGARYHCWRRGRDVPRS